MPLGKDRAGDFRSGTPVTLPKNFGNSMNLSSSPAAQDFGNPNPSNTGNQNVVSWTPSPSHFGNQIGGTPATPTFLPAAGSFNQSQVVLIVSAGADAIHFTTDGTVPTAASPLYQGSVRVNVTETIKAISVINGVSSAVGSAAYTITQ